jgi:hypothetical protein
MHKGGRKWRKFILQCIKLNRTGWCRTIGRCGNSHSYISTATVSSNEFEHDPLLAELSEKVYVIMLYPRSW